MQIQEIMTPKVLTIELTTPLAEIVVLMRKNNFSSLSVVDHEHHLMGVVRQENLISHDTDLHLPSYIEFLEALPVEGDARKEISQAIKSVTQMPAAMLMEKEIAVVNPETDVRVVVAIFTEQHINSIPVVDEKNCLKGLVCRGDLLSLIGGHRQSLAKKSKNDKINTIGYKILKL